MKTQQRIVELGKKARDRYWSVGSDVSKQTKKSQRTCKEWQEAVVAEFGERFKAEHPLNEAVRVKRSIF